MTQKSQWKSVFTAKIKVSWDVTSRNRVGRWLFRRNILPPSSGKQPFQRWR